MTELYKKVLKKIKEYDNIVVLRHQVPDFDASGSQFGFATWLKDNFKGKNIYVVGKPHKIFAPKLYPETSVEAKIEGKYLCLVLDVANKARIDDPNNYVDGADYVIKIDHHPADCDLFGDLAIVDEHAAAAAELIAEMLISCKKTISKECAYYLYSAIVGDSGRFMYSDTSTRTFKVVTELMKTGFDFQDIYYKMYTKSISEISVIKHIYDVVQFSKHNVAYYIIDANKIKELGVSRESIKAFVNQFANYEEIKIWVQVTEDLESEPEYRWAISIRSRGVKVNDVANRFCGGGHDNAAGCRLPTLEKVHELIEALDALL